MIIIWLFAQQRPNSHVLTKISWFGQNLKIKFNSLFLDNLSLSNITYGWLISWTIYPLPPPHPPSHTPSHTPPHPPTHPTPPHPTPHPQQISSLILRNLWWQTRHIVRSAEWPVHHYSDVKCSRWRLKSPAPRLFTGPFVRAHIKENIKAPRHWPLWLEFTSDSWFNNMLIIPADVVYNNPKPKWNCNV